MYECVKYMQLMVFVPSNTTLFDYGLFIVIQ